MPETTPPDRADDAEEDLGRSNPDPRRPIGEIIASRYGRRAPAARRA